MPSSMIDIDHQAIRNLMMTLPMDLNTHASGISADQMTDTDNKSMMNDDGKH